MTWLPSSTTSSVVATPRAVPPWSPEPSNASVVARSRNETRPSSPTQARTPTWTASRSTRPPRRWTTSTDAPHSREWGASVEVVHRRGGRVLREAVQVGVRACVGEDGRVSFRDLSTTLAFEGSGYHGGAARGVAVADEVVDERNQVIRQSDGDLCAHTKTIPEWDAPERGMSVLPDGSSTVPGRAHRLLVALTSGPVPGEARSRRPGCRSLFGCPRLVVWLSHGLRIPGTARAGRGSRGVCSARSSGALPARQPHRFEQREDSMVVQSGRVVIGMDPHKRSVTIEVMAGDETILGGGRFATDPDGFTALVEYVRAWPQRVWAIEGCNGIGRHVALRLLAQGQEVVDVPPKMSARARVFATGQVARPTRPASAPPGRPGCWSRSGTSPGSPNRAHFASWTGTAPIDASSGDHVRHRLSRAGNRQINRVLHIMAIVELRNPGIGRDYYDRKKAGGKTSMEAMRALKRRLSDVVYRAMLDDAIAHVTGASGTGPGAMALT